MAAASLFRERLATTEAMVAGDSAVPRAAAAHSLSLVRVSKRYGPIVAVDDVSLTVPRGEFLTLLGPSGSGKTTLLMMIAGFVQPTSGEILVDERPITNLAPERRNFGMVFQGYALFPHMTVAENIAYPLKVRGMNRAAIAERVKAALALVRLEGFGDRHPRQLSGGQQQRVAIARALVFTPNILLLDEPLGALDRKLRGEVQLELKMLHEQLGTTFIYVTHDQEEALSMSDRVAIADRGRIVQTGTPFELYERPRTRFVASFLGKSNFLVGNVVRREGDAIVYRTAGREFVHRGEAARLPETPSLLFALRPEKLTLTTQEPADAVNRVPGRIAALSYLGATLDVAVTTDGLGTISATLLAGTQETGLGVGTPVWLSWAPEATVPLAAEDENPTRFPKQA